MAKIRAYIRLLFVIIKTQSYLLQNGWERANQKYLCDSNFEMHPYNDMNLS